MFHFLRKSFTLQLLLLITCTSGLPGCASPDKPGVPEKVGMHIDAELEFAIAYPLDWRKERRIPLNRQSGSVIWTLPGPAGRGTFEVISLPFKADARTADDLPALVGEKYPGFSLASLEQTELPAGPAVHLSGSASQSSLSAHLLQGPRRDYLLILSAAVETIEQFSEVLDEMLLSFQMLGNKP